jgi:hypothetical protein
MDRGNHGVYLMAKAIFYDRKHNCEVSADQIYEINFVTTLARTQDDYERSSRKTISGAYEMQTGALGYKSPECPRYQNWDRWLNYIDLVFLRFEQEEDEPVSVSTNSDADRIKELEDRLKKINDLIYAKGAPLGTVDYFEIRELATIK